MEKAVFLFAHHKRKINRLFQLFQFMGENSAAEFGRVVIKLRKRIEIHRHALNSKVLHIFVISRCCFADDDKGSKNQGPVVQSPIKLILG